MHIKKPTVVKAAGNKPKQIEEFIGLVNSATSDLSIARMKSPAGWEEPPQTPEFDEYTFVLNGFVEILLEDAKYIVKSNEAFIAPKGKRVQYSTPKGAEYIAVCLPAFSPNNVHREE